MNRDGPDFEIRVADWFTVEQAQEHILGAATVLPSELVPLADSLGRALSEDLRATATIPPWDNAAMDGYAVRGDDVVGASPAAPVTLDVVGRTQAGDVPGDSLTPGQAIRIMTGAPVPPGADSVVRVEDTDSEAESGVVRVLKERDRGRNVRRYGQDMEPGDVVLVSGSAVTPGVIGVLATLGLDSAPLRRRPRVGILATGDELRGPDRYEEVRAGGGVPESNGPMLAAAVSMAGATAVSMGTARDRPEAISEALDRYQDVDVLVTLGGASMGEADLVKRVLEDRGLELGFWRVKMRPGSPFSFGLLPRRGGGAMPVFSLPGNPSSAFVTFELFVRPFLLTLAGHRNVFRRTIRCRAGDELRAPSDMALYYRVCLEGSTPPLATLTGPQGSGLVTGLAVAAGLAVVPRGVEVIGEGDEVDVLLLDDAPATSPPRATEPADAQG